MGEGKRIVAKIETYKREGEGGRRRGKEKGKVSKGLCEWGVLRAPGDGRRGFWAGCMGEGVWGGVGGRKEGMDGWMDGWMEVSMLVVVDWRGVPWVGGGENIGSGRGWPGGRRVRVVVWKGKGKRRRKEKEKEKEVVEAAILNSNGRDIGSQRATVRLD